MKVAVTGSRDRGEWGVLCEALDEVKPTLIIQGGARGVDQLARQYANSRGIQYVTYHYRTQMGKAGGPMRNRAMMELGQPDILIAMPGGTGTADCIAQAKRAGVKVRQPENPDE